MISGISMVVHRQGKYYIAQNAAILVDGYRGFPLNIREPLLTYAKQPQAPVTSEGYHCQQSCDQNGLTAGKKLDAEA
jgi:hypothetical protein